jgi:hypothetical protein
VRHDGLAVVTIRPIEHWDFVSTLSPEQKEQKKNEHRSTGFAFDAYEMPGSDAYQLYGENSITLDWIDRSGTGWEVVGHDRGIDGLQTIVALAPV